MKPIQEDSLIEPSIDNLLDHVENKYILSMLAAKRARQLFEGEDALIEEDYINKVTTAINEINVGKVRYILEEDLEQHTD